MEETIYVLIRIDFKSKLSKEKAIDEISSNCIYDFPSTENVEVTDTEWEETYDEYPE